MEVVSHPLQLPIFQPVSGIRILRFTQDDDSGTEHRNLCERAGWMEGIMTGGNSTETVDVDSLRLALERADADALIDLYADDAEIRIVDRNHQPSRPETLRGREAIGEYLRDVGGREMTHRIEQVVEGNDRLAYTESCEYPDGTRVLYMGMLELRDGKIARQVGVQVWDE